MESDERDCHMLENQISQIIEIGTGLKTAVFVKAGEELEIIACKHPLQKDDNDKNLHVTLISGMPSAKSVKELENSGDGIDIFIVRKDVVYAYYEKGYGKSKFTNNYLEKILNVTATTRNWKTMNKMLEMIRE